MRIRPAALVLVAAAGAFLFLLPGASAEAFLDDAAGDTEAKLDVNGQGSAVPLSAEQVQAADLLALDIVEDEVNLALTLTAGSTSEPAGFHVFRFFFDWAGTPYQVTFVRRTFPTLGEFTYCALLVYQDNFYREAAVLEHTFDPASGTYQATLPKVYILGADNKVPLTGDLLKDAYVEAYTYRFGFRFLVPWTVQISDRMPDDGGVEYAFKGGGEATGHLVLGSPYPVRVSNGGATTFVYKAVVRNTASFEDSVSLTFAEMPDGWRGSVQSPQTVPAGVDKEINVLLTVPFGHEHGGYQAFRLIGTSGKDANVKASVKMGVLHTPTPMPEGHHPDLFLHGQNENDFPVFGTVFPFTEGSMNTLSDHSADAPSITPNGGGSSPDGGQRMSWWISLSPALALGLDFDLARTGTMVGSVTGGGPGEGQVSAELYLSRAEGGGNNNFRGGGAGDDAALLARSAEPGTVTLDPQGSASFRLTMLPEEASEYIPWSPRQNLILAVHLDNPGPTSSFCCFGPTQPALVTGDFKLSLPLNEYDDVLTGLEGVVSAVSLVPEGAVEKSVRPGAIATYEFSLRNDGVKEDAFSLSIQGSQADRGTVVPEGPIKLGPGESAKIILAVSVPSESTNGQLFDVILAAIARSDPSILAIARTKTTALLDADPTTDDSAILTAAREQAAENETPGPAAIAALGVLAIVAVASRRRG